MHVTLTTRFAVSVSVMKGWRYVSFFLHIKKKYYVEKGVEFLNQDRSEKTVNIQR